MMLTVGWILKGVLPLRSPLAKRQTKMGTYMCAFRELLGRHGPDSNEFVLITTIGDDSWSKNKDTKHGMASCNISESLNKCPWLAKLWKLYLRKTCNQLQTTD